MNKLPIGRKLNVSNKLNKKRYMTRRYSFMVDDFKVMLDLYDDKLNDPKKFEVTKDFERAVSRLAEESLDSDETDD